MTWLPNNYASSASDRRPLASAFRVFSAVFRAATVALSGRDSTIARRVRRGAMRQQAQSDALAGLAAVYARKMDLLIAKEIVATERREAVRLHRPVSSIDRRLRAINAELLSID